MAIVQRYFTIYYDSTADTPPAAASYPYFKRVDTSTGLIEFSNGTTWVAVTVASATVADNTITNAKIAAHTSTKITITNKAQLPSDTVYTGDSQTLTGKTLTAPIIATIVNGGGTLTLPNITTSIMGRTTADTMTNKTYDATGTGNVLSNVGDAHIASHTSTKITITAKGQLPSDTMYTGDTQTITNKTHTNPTINSATINGTISVTSAGTAPLIISKTTDTGQDKILQVMMSDDANSYLSIENGTGTAGSFVPTFLTKQGSNFTAGLFLGQATTDSGSAPILLLRARISTGTAVATRPLCAVSNLNTAGNVTTWNVANMEFLDAYDLKFGATTGTKIGTATTEKIGFWGKTPVVQPTAVADATDAASVIARLNELLARCRTTGIIAT